MWLSFTYRTQHSYFILFFYFFEKRSVSYMSANIVYCFCIKYFLSSVYVSKFKPQYGWLYFSEIFHVLKFINLYHFQKFILCPVLSKLLVNLIRLINRWQNWWYAKQSGFSYVSLWFKVNFALSVIRRIRISEALWQIEPVI